MESGFNPIAHPICLDLPRWYETTAWGEHIPFAMYAVSALRPRTFVELGTYYGTSYFSFCQAVKASGIETACHAVDTWEGDEHAGEIEAVVLPRLMAHNDRHYADFSQLVQSTFDEARDHFPDGSIDLLHIDGFHSYKAVKHDFETWLPKMSNAGVVLFHDVNVREKGFGVWKFWEELREKYESFTFLHGHGLGVLAVGDKSPSGFGNLFAADEKETAAIRNFFHQYGASIEAVNKFQSQNEYINHLQTFERLVMRSRLMRGYRILRYEGVGSLIRKAKKGKDESSV